MVDYKITKVNKLLEVNNDMVHNFYFIIYGKMFNEEKTKYRRFKYIEWFDVFDVMEYFETDYYNDKLVREYLGCLENNYLMSIRDFNDKERLKEFYDYCNETIKDYNGVAKYYI
jgi:hypothetical protein